MQLRHQVICFQSEINVGTILGIVIIIIGFLVRVIFYRCPECGVMIPWRPLNVKHCPNCGKNYSISSFDFSIEKLENQIIFE